MKNYWLERSEAKALTMEQRIEKMLAPHHVIWLGDDTVGKTVPDQIFIDAGGVPEQITVSWPQMSEWDSNTTFTVDTMYCGTAGPTQLTSDQNPHSDLPPTYFDISAFNTQIKAEVENAIDAEFARLVESEGWNLDL